MEKQMFFSFPVELKVNPFFSGHRSKNEHFTNSCDDRYVFLQAVIADWYSSYIFRAHTVNATVFDKSRSCYADTGDISHLTYGVPY